MHWQTKKYIVKMTETLPVNYIFDKETLLKSLKLHCNSKRGQTPWGKWAQIPVGSIPINIILHISNSKSISLNKS